MTASLLLVLSFCVPSLQEPDPAALVRRLGSETFEVRRQAEEDLLQLGPKAEESLRKGLNDGDAQVRDLCRQLLGKIQQTGLDARFRAFLEDKDDRLTPPLPGWKHFAALAGNGPAQRQRFLDLYRHVEPAFEEIERDPKKAAALLAPRLDAARTALLTPSKEEDALRELLALLLVAGDARVPLDAAAFGRVCGLLTILAERAAVVKTFRGDAVVRRAAWDFLKERSSAATQTQAATMALALELTEARDWALQQALDARQTPLLRGWAVLLAFKVDGKEAAARLEPLLNDITVVGNFTLGTTKLTAELRDVTLAALLHSQGRKMEESGFPYPQTIPGLKTLPSPERLGFADAATREAVFKKWQAALKEK